MESKSMSKTDRGIVESFEVCGICCEWLSLNDVWFDVSLMNNGSYAAHCLPAAILKCIGHYGLDVSWTCPISG
jgi:hypothetical protein